MQEQMNATMALSSIASLNMLHSRLFKETTTALSNTEALNLAIVNLVFCSLLV